MNYHEPFLGGGALFFALWTFSQIVRRPFRARLSDLNEEVVDAFRGVGTIPREVMKAIDGWDLDERTYYRVRSMRPWEIDSLAVRAARTIYLNKTCFNGLYRTGPDPKNPRLGNFNVPWGKRESVTVYDPTELLRASDAIENGAQVAAASFTESMKAVGEGDLVYLDPPYVPVTRTSFTEYGSGAFTYADHERLFDLATAAIENGAWVMLSNSSTPWVRAELESRGFFLNLVRAKRSIGASSESRGEVEELVAVGGPGIEPGRENVRRK